MEIHLRGFTSCEIRIFSHNQDTEIMCNKIRWNVRFITDLFYLETVRLLKKASKIDEGFKDIS